MRIIHSKHYLSHTDPLFKTAKILKLPDLYTQAQLKFCRKYVVSKLPKYFLDLNLRKNSDIHNYDTTHKNSYVLAKPISIEISRKRMTYVIPSIRNNLSAPLNEAMYSQHDHVIATSFKYQTLSKYSDRVRCDRGVPCWPCSVMF